MGDLQIYRKRYIPSECILLKDDVIIRNDSDVIITTWKTLHPKPNFSHGCSCYFLNEGMKVSKIYRPDNTILHWYCDIVEYERNEKDNTLIVTDLLADVIIDADGSFKVVDLDELSEALEQKLITPKQASKCLRSLHNLLSLLYRDKFDRLQAYLNEA